jgi:hypothetical protein
MKIQNALIQAVFAALMAARITAQAQYTYTTVFDPAGIGTTARGVSSGNIVGDYQDSNDNSHGFLFNGSSWTNLDDPLAGSGPGQGTIPTGVEETNIVGAYVDSNNAYHGFLGL